MITLPQQDLNELNSFVKANYGIDLSNKKTFVELRVQKSMLQHGYTNFADFFSFVCSDPTGVLLADFISSLTVNYTLFNREAGHFEFLTTKILPELCQQEKTNRNLHIWSAGCATGEEPYTLAMILSDYFNIQKTLWDTKILATDISTTALQKAQAGEYPAESIRGLNPNWVKRYFVMDPKEPDMVRIASSIRSEIIFRKHNLVGAPFQFKSKFHLIFCRNVMIYFEENMKRLLINRFYDALEDGGYLFIGMSETIEKEWSNFSYVQPSVYRREPSK